MTASHPLNFPHYFINLTTPSFYPREALYQDETFFIVKNDSDSSPSILHHVNSFLLALAGVGQWIECRLRTKESRVRFPVRARAWVAGQVPSGAHVRDNHTLIFLTLSFSFSSPLSKNK